MVEIADDPSIIAPTLEYLQEGYNTGRTRSVDYRKKQIQNLQKALIQNFDKIQAAMLSDLGYQTEILTQMCALTTLKQQIDHTLEHVEEWSQEKQVESNLMLGMGQSKIIPEPYGVTLVIGSWNYPFITVVGPAVEAIAAGNAVCLKPSELAPRCSNIIKEIFDKHLDPSVYRVIEGQQEVSKNICYHKWDLIIFTGSPAKGKLIAKAAAENLIPCILELGGKSPTIVDQGADLTNAALRISVNKFINCGQTCIAPDYVLCHESNVDKLVDKFKTTLKDFYTTDASNSKDYTRIISTNHTERLHKMLDVQDHKGKVVIGGQCDISERYIEPTIVLNPSLDSQLMKEEIFGPILPIVTFKEINQAIKHIKSNPKPLALYYFGDNKENITKIVQTTSSGAIVQNDCMLQIMNPNLPFGGIGNSGSSSLHGIYGFNNCSHMKPVVYADNKNRFPANIRFPPYTPDKFGNIFPKRIMRQAGQLGLFFGLGISTLVLLKTKKQQ